MLSLLFFDFFDVFLGVSETELDGESLGVTSLLRKNTQASERANDRVGTERRNQIYLLVEPAELVDVVLSGVWDMLWCQKNQDMLFESNSNASKNIHVE